MEPFIQNRSTRFEKRNDRTVEILGGSREFVFELLSPDIAIELGADEEKYKQPFPALKGYPITIKLRPDAESFLEEIRYRITVRN